MRYPNRLLLPAAWVVGIGAAVVTLGAQQRAAVPNADAQQAVRKPAADIYGDRFARARSGAQKTALAREVFDAAMKCACRGLAAPVHRGRDYGFRVARTVAP